MGHFDNILCRYKRYYFGKTLKCEIKSYSLGWPKYSGRFSTFVHTAKVEVETPFFSNSTSSNWIKWFRWNSKVLWRRVSDRGILACMHVLKASQGSVEANFLAKGNRRILLDFIRIYFRLWTFLWLKTCVFELLIVHARFGWWHFGEDGQSGDWESSTALFLFLATWQAIPACWSDDLRSNLLISHLYVLRQNCT